jgi:protein-L-isoaspartate(D-aspartate) O-methyltransferase
LPGTDRHSLPSDAPAADFAALRQRMVDNQLRPSEVTDHAVIRAFLSVPREKFVAPEERPFAYADRDLRLAGARHRGLMAPVQLARLVQLLPRTPATRLLVVGCGSGYAAAILTRLVGMVVGVEEDERLAALAAETLAELGVGNFVLCLGDLEAGCEAHAPYDGMLVDGSIEVFPDALRVQLAPGGVAVGVERGERISRAMLWERVGDDPARWPQFEAWAPPLPGFLRKREFVF